MIKQPSDRPAEDLAGWDWFQSSPIDDGDGKNEEGALQLARAFARCFSSDDGRRVLAHLQSLTMERSLGPDSTDNLLRHLEGQRQLVSYMTKQVERGRR